MKTLLILALLGGLMELATAVKPALNTVSNRAAYIDQQVSQAQK